MKSTVLRYGFYGAISMIIVFLVTWLVFRSHPDYGLQEVLGYAGIIISLSFVFFGIRYYRDHVKDGSLSFGEGMKLGLLISLIPAAAFGLFDILYVMVLDPQFYDRYYDYILEGMKGHLSEAEYQAKLSQVESEKAFFESPLVQFCVMFITVFLIGTIITVISTLILKRKTVGSPVRNS